MTTELTLREKVTQMLLDWEYSDQYTYQAIDRIADLLSATGAPAYCRVADDLRGVVREEPLAPARYLGQFDKRTTLKESGE